MTLIGAAGTDLFIGPSGTAAVPDAGRLTGPPPPGDFMLSARVSVGFASTFDAGVLLVEASQQRWAKLCFELSPQPTAVTVVTRDFSDDCNSFEVTSQELWLRVTRTGVAWAFHASVDGQWWRLLRYFTLQDAQARAQQQPVPVRVGFLAQSPNGNGCTATLQPDHLARRRTRGLAGRLLVPVSSAATRSPLVPDSGHSSSLRMILSPACHVRQRYAPGAWNR